MNNIKWNNQIKLVLADVDETIADLYLPASKELIIELEKLLKKGLVIFLISGGWIKSIQPRITDLFQKDLRAKIIIAHCSGSEVWGFKKNGDLEDKAFYSVYDKSLTESQKKEWRKIIEQIIKHFGLKTHRGTMPIADFNKKYGKDPLAIMLDDRGPQITFELPSSYDLSPSQAQRLGVEKSFDFNKYDLRIPIADYASQLLKESDLPITARLGGMFAIDFAIEGVSKTTAIKKILANKKILQDLGLPNDISEHPEWMEIWGDKFSTTQGGTDRHMSEALPKKVRSISFREENPEEFPKGYNIVVWDGEKYLHDGLLEYLQSRS